jgi:hypothetical protein
MAKVQGGIAPPTSSSYWSQYSSREHLRQPALKPESAESSMRLGVIESSPRQMCIARATREFGSMKSDCVSARRRTKPCSCSGRSRRETTSATRTGGTLRGLTDRRQCFGGEDLFGATSSGLAWARAAATRST